MGTQLETGAAFPSLMAKDLDGADVDITASVAGHWSAVLIYRGHW